MLDLEMESRFLELERWFYSTQLQRKKKWVWKRRREWVRKKR